MVTCCCLHICSRWLWCTCCICVGLVDFQVTAYSLVLLLFAVAALAESSRSREGL